MCRHIICVIAILILAACSDNEEESTVSEGYDSVHKCDEFAAHPDDPGKWASGVSEDELAPGPAIKFCTEAVNEHPDTPRFDFQLGRSLLKARQYDLAIEHLVKAADRDYAPAYAYLADVYRYGLLGEEDLETAEAYYDIAIAGGFTPAEDAKLGLYDGGGDEVGQAYTEEVATESEEYYQPPPKPLADKTYFDPEGFALGGVLLALHDGEFEGLETLDSFLINKYLASLNNYFSEPYNMIDESCSAFANPRLSKIILKRAMSDMGLGMEKSAEERGMNALIMTGKLMQGMMQDGGAALYERGMDIDVTEQSGTKDGVRLAQKYGCESGVVKRLYANIESFARGDPPKYLTGLAKFKSECKSTAMDNGSNAQKADGVCSCFTDKFARTVSKADIEWISNNYDQGKNFNRVTAKYGGLKQEIAGCLLK